MRKPVQLIGTTLAATAIVGATGTAAMAQGGDHAGYSGQSFGDHHSFGDHSSSGPGRWFAHGSTDRLGSDPGRDTPFSHPQSPGDDAWTVPVRHHDAPSDSAVTFDQRKAAIVSALTAADDRLGELESVLSNAAANDPTGHAADALARVTEAREKVESLLSQVQAATTPEQLDAILAQLHDSWFGAPTPTA